MDSVSGIRKWSPEACSGWRDSNHIDYHYRDYKQGKCSCGEGLWAKV